MTNKTPFLIGDFTAEEQADAQAMAEAVNGGDWSTNYTPSQRVGWCLKIRWARERYRVARAGRRHGPRGEQEG